MAVWVSEGAVVIDDQGRVIICDDCPCETGTGTGTGSVETLCCDGVFLPSSLCVRINGVSLNVPGTGTGIGDPLVHENWITIIVNYDETLGYWIGGAYWDGSQLVMDGSRWWCNPACNGGGIPPDALWPVGATVSCESAGGGTFLFKVIIYTVDICTTIPWVASSNNVQEYWLEGTIVGTTPDDGFYVCSPFATTVEPNGTCIQISAGTYTGGADTGTDSGPAPADSCGIITGDNANTFAGECQGFKLIPRYLKVTNTTGGPVFLETARAGNTCGFSFATDFDDKTYPTLGGLLLSEGGCTWSNCHTDKTEVHNVSPIPLGFSTFRSKNCGTFTLSNEGGLMVATIENTAGDCFVPAYSLTFTEQTNAGSGSGSGTSGPYDGSCPLKLYFSGGSGGTWKKGLGAGTLLTSSDYITVQPYCGYDFPPCATLNAPNTLYLTIESDCPDFDGITITLQRCLHYTSNVTDTSENSYRFTGYELVSCPGAMGPLAYMDFELMTVEDEAPSYTFRLYMTTWCLPSTTNCVAPWDTCDESSELGPGSGVVYYSLSLISCDPLYLDSGTAELSKDHIAENTFCQLVTFRTTSVCPDSGGPYTIRLTVTE